MLNYGVLNNGVSMLSIFKQLPASSYFSPAFYFLELESESNYLLIGRLFNEPTYIYIMEQQ